MASNQRLCPFHTESSLSFCLNHGIYCCPHCHATSNAECGIKSVEDAVDYFRNEAQKSTVMLKQSTQRCTTMTLGLTKVQGVIQKRHGDVVNSIHLLCDQIRSSVGRFEAEAILDANQESLSHANSLGKHIESVDILSEFSSTLNTLLDIDGGSSAQQRKCTPKSLDINNIRIDLEQFRDGFSAISERLKKMECLPPGEYDAPFYIEQSRVDNLVDELSEICQDTTKAHKEGRPEDTPTSVLTGTHSRFGSAPMDQLKTQLSSKTIERLAVSSWESSSTPLHDGLVSEHVENKSSCALPDQPLLNAPMPPSTTIQYEAIEYEHQLVCENMTDIPHAGLTKPSSTECRESVQSHSSHSGVVDTYSTECGETVASPTLVNENSKTSVEKSKEFSSEESSTLMSSEYTAYIPLPTAHEGCPNDDNLTQSLFTKLDELRYTGCEPAVCFVPSTSGHLLVAANKPNMLIKFDDNGIEMVRRESPTRIHDICVRGTMIYATGAECSVRVFDVDSLSSVETLCGLGVCLGINSFGEEFVITCPVGDRKGVYLVGIETGVLNVQRKSPYLFKYPMFVTSSASLDKIVVSDTEGNLVVILSSKLCPMRKLNLGEDMMRPNGLCVVDRTVVIACHKSKSVVEYGIDDEYTTTIFDSDDAVGSPRTISYHGESRRLAVSSTANPKSVFLFKKKECNESSAVVSDVRTQLCSNTGVSQMPSACSDAERYSHESQDDMSCESQMTTTESESDNAGGATYRKIFEFDIMGFDPVARYIQSNPAYILLTCKQPNTIRKLSESGEEFARNVTVASVNDFCVRDGEIYTGDSDGIIRVYNLGNLSLLRAVDCAFQECTGICTIGAGLAILHKSQSCWCVSRISATGDIKGTLSHKFKHPLFIALDRRSDGVGLVTDVADNCIVVVQGNLSSCRKISHPLIRQPHGVCTDGVCVFVACHGSRSVLEFHSDYRYRRTILTAAVDGIGVPRTISCHRNYGHLVVSSSADPKKLIIFSREG